MDLFTTYVAVMLGLLERTSYEPTLAEDSVEPIREPVEMCLFRNKKLSEQYCLLQYWVLLMLIYFKITLLCILS